MRKPKRPVRIRCVCASGAGTSEEYMHLVHRALAYRAPKKSDGVVVERISRLKPHIAFEQKEPGRRTIKLTRHGTSGDIMQSRQTHPEILSTMLSTQHLRDADVVVVWDDWLLESHGKLRNNPGYTAQLQRLISEDRIIRVGLASQLSSLGRKLKKSFGRKSSTKMTREEAAELRAFRRRLIDKISK